ncbi:MAG: YidC/Oxa1 family membrane protein insertase [Lachnospiraceae bacterium]|nr:YidC/Oxa1 family membrane protein insertase [Lachnospiraceae bacterium]
MAQILTQYQGKILGPIAWVLGKLMNGIFILLSTIGIPNVGLTIILFTFVIYMCLMPLTIKQQKFSKLSAKMNPELQAIQAKYKGKKDQQSMMMQQQEIQDLYGKYGVSSAGSCVQLVIQMPILFALYRVIYAIPAYVTQVKETYLPLVKELLSTSGTSEFLQNLQTASMFKNQFSSEAFEAVVGNEVAQNTYIDVLNKASTADWTSLAEAFPDLSGIINSTHDTILKMNTFLFINIGDSPWYTLQTALSTKRFGLFIVAIIVPFLAAFTQWINVKLMPTAQQASAGGNDQAAQMQQSMKMMNSMMPLMSAFFCFTLPSGMGLYWISGSVIRSVQQVFINKHIDKMDIDAQIAKNEEKYKEKKKKRGEITSNMNQYAQMRTRNTTDATKFTSSVSLEDKQAAIDNATSIYDSGKASKKSLLAKANMVREFDNRGGNASSQDKGDA